jgi:hypothetical protein
VIVPVAATDSLREFDRWQATFAAVGAFPPRWEGLHTVPPARTPAAVAYQLRKLILLEEWLDMLARGSAEHRRYAERGIKVRAVRQDATRPCPGCDPLIVRALTFGIDAMPPFHPGCRCVLVAVPEAPLRRRVRAGSRRPSLVG